MNNYSVTLDEKIVEKAKKIIEPNGGKLSPVLNNLLKKWVEENSKDISKDKKQSDNKIKKENKVEKNVKNFIKDMEEELNSDEDLI